MGLEKTTPFFVGNKIVFVPYATFKSYPPNDDSLE